MARFFLVAILIAVAILAIFWMLAAEVPTSRFLPLAVVMGLAFASLIEWLLRKRGKAPPSDGEVPDATKKTNRAK